MELDNKLAQDIERAATSLLTDEEIRLSLEITDETLGEYYHIVERARIKLKQSLNAKRITQAALDGSAGDIVEAIPRTKSRRGGSRPGSGRPVGTANKISAKEILASIEQHTGEKFEDLLAQGYMESIEKNDHQLRLKYETLFLNKVVADKVDITSLGASLAPIIEMNAKEIPDYIQVDYVERKPS